MTISVVDRDGEPVGTDKLLFTVANVALLILAFSTLALSTLGKLVGTDAPTFMTLPATLLLLFHPYSPFALWKHLSTHSR